MIEILVRIPGPPWPSVASRPGRLTGNLTAPEKPGRGPGRRDRRDRGLDQHWRPGTSPESRRSLPSPGASESLAGRQHQRTLRPFAIPLGATTTATAGACHDMPLATLPGPSPRMGPSQHGTPGQDPGPHLDTHPSGPVTTRSQASAPQRPPVRRARRRPRASLRHRWWGIAGGL